MKINAEAIIAFRRDKSWSQEELAIAAGLNLRTIQRIEAQGTASLQSRKALASALGVDLNDLNYEETPMKICPECHSNNTYRYKKTVATHSGAGTDLLPGLDGFFRFGEFIPVVCGDCGYVRFFTTEGSLKGVKASKLWEKL